MTYLSKYYFSAKISNIYQRTNFKKCLFFSLCILFTTKIFAQDIIHLRDSTTIKAIIEEIATNDINFRKYGDTDLSTYSLKKSDVIRINYNNGDIQSFGANERIIITKVNQDRDDENDFLKGKQNNNRSYNDQFSILSFGYGLPGSSFTDAEANLYGLKDPQWK